MAHGQLTNGAIRQWRAKVRIDELDKLRLGGAAAIEFHTMEPKLGVIEQVEHHER
jgi:hypothetical protein